jgi:hypothetical protein
MRVPRAASGWGPRHRLVVDIPQLGAVGKNRRHPQQWAVHQVLHLLQNRNQKPRQRTFSSFFHQLRVQAQLARRPGTVWVLGRRRRVDRSRPGEGNPLVVLPLRLDGGVCVCEGFGKSVALFKD